MKLYIKLLVILCFILPLNIAFGEQIKIEKNYLKDITNSFLTYRVRLESNFDHHSLTPFFSDNLIQKIQKKFLSTNNNEINLEVAFKNYLSVFTIGLDIEFIYETQVELHELDEATLIIKAKTFMGKYYTINIPFIKEGYWKMTGESLYVINNDLKESALSPIIMFKKNDNSHTLWLNIRCGSIWENSLYECLANKDKWNSGDSLLNY